MTAPTWRDLPPAERRAFVEALARENIAGLERAYRGEGNFNADGHCADLLAALARLDQPAPRCVRHRLAFPFPGGQVEHDGVWVPEATMARVREALRSYHAGLGFHPYQCDQLAALLRELEAE